jgi:hypothetical protein
MNTGTCILYVVPCTTGRNLVFVSLQYEYRSTSIIRNGERPADYESSTLDTLPPTSDIAQLMTCVEIVLAMSGSGRNNGIAPNRLQVYQSSLSLSFHNSS